MAPKKPWISDRTFSLINERNNLRKHGLYIEEKMKTIEIKRAVKIDKTRWIHSQIASGDWSKIKNLRKPPKSQQGRLYNDSTKSEANKVQKHSKLLN